MESVFQSSTGNTHFVWRVPNTGRIEIFSRSQQVVERICPQLPIFHTRVMCKTMFSKFGRVAPTVKPSASNDLGEAEVNERVEQLLQMEPDDSNLIMTPEEQLLERSR